MELNVNHCGTNYFLRFSLLVIERKMKKKYMILLSALSLASSTFAQTGYGIRETTKSGWEIK